MGNVVMLGGALTGQSGWRKLQPYLLAAGLSALLGAVGYAMVNVTTEELILADARQEAERWVADVGRVIPNLHELAFDSARSREVADLIKGATAAGHLQSVVVFGPDGQLLLGSLPSPEMKLPTAEALLAARHWAASSVQLHEFTRAGHVYNYTASAVPLRNGGQIAAWFVLIADHTSRHDLVLDAVRKASLGMALLLSTMGITWFFHRNRERRHTARQMEWLAERDQLTGLPNKQAFLKTIEQQRLPSSGKDHAGAVILCEAVASPGLIHSFGEEIEDALACAAATRLAAHSRGRYEAARAGRLMFGLCITHTSDLMDILSLAKELTAVLCEPLIWNGQPLAVQAHAGVALMSRDGDTAETLYRNAELALHSAQEQGSPGYGFFNPEIAKDMRRQAAVQSAIARAAASKSFRLDYQPIYNIRTGELTGFEALIRLIDEDLGTISPGEFIPVAEQMGLISSIGLWCLQEACRVAAEWPPHLLVSVNLSPSQFQAGSLVSDVRSALEQAGLPAYRLEVEITEGTLLNASEMVMVQLRMLRDMGVAVALDDFGTGYSSLGYLWKFPFSKLKIDRSFVHALDETPTAKGILRSIVKLGHGLGLTVTAEGIETQKQFGVLRDLGCDLAQGFLLDRPAQVTDVAAIIMRNFANGLPRRARDPSLPDRSAA